MKNTITWSHWYGLASYAKSSLWIVPFFAIALEMIVSRLIPLAKLGRQSAAASAPILAGLHKAWRDIELAVRQSAKRFRDTG